MTFATAIVKRDKYECKNSFQRWFFYEFELNSKYILVFMSCNLNSQAEINGSLGMLKDLKEQAEGFATAGMHLVAYPFSINAYSDYIEEVD